MLTWLVKKIFNFFIYMYVCQSMPSMCEWPGAGVIGIYEPDVDSRNLTWVCKKQYLLLRTEPSLQLLPASFKM